MARGCPPVATRPKLTLFTYAHITGPMFHRFDGGPVGGDTAGADVARGIASALCSSSWRRTTNRPPPALWADASSQASWTTGVGSGRLLAPCRSAGQSSEAARLAQMVATESGPEMVNDGKTLYGPLVIADIGLDEIRRKCPHADRGPSRLSRRHHRLALPVGVTQIRPTTERQDYAQPAGVL
jgi:hypothetical protein